MAKAGPELSSTPPPVAGPTAADAASETAAGLAAQLAPASVAPPSTPRLESEPDRDPPPPTQLVDAPDEQQDAPPAGDLRLDRASAGAFLGSAFFAFPAVAVLVTGLALGYRATAMIAVFLVVAVPLGLLGSVIVGFTSWRTLRRWPIEPAPASAERSVLPPIKLHTALSVLLAGLLVAALLLAPPSGSGGAAGGLAGVAGSLAIAAYLGSLPLRSYERKHWTLLWVDRRSKGLKTFFTTDVPAPSHAASALRFEGDDPAAGGDESPAASSEPPDASSEPPDASSGPPDESPEAADASAPARD
ncbi:MAG TPA: hypothetical protein VKY26_03885 [Actinomycetota bacterium]|nr:hypothetical protein [Actinomycetota bacterium]